MYEEEWRNLPFRYDVGWYFSIAENGYGFSLDNSQQPIVFFPAFPLAVRTLALTAVTIGCFRQRPLWQAPPGNASPSRITGPEVTTVRTCAHSW